MMVSIFGRLAPAVRQLAARSLGCWNSAPHKVDCRSTTRKQLEWITERCLLPSVGMEYKAREEFICFQFPFQKESTVGWLCSCYVGAQCAMCCAAGIADPSLCMRQLGSAEKATSPLESQRRAGNLGRKLDCASVLQKKEAAVECHFKVGMFQC